MRYIFCFCAFLFCSQIMAATLDVEAYAKLPLVEQPQISPDGQMIAALYNLDDGPQVVVAPFPTLEFSTLAKLKKNRDRLEFIRWSGNKYLIISASYPEYFQGRHFRVQRLYAINVEDGSSKEITNRRFSSQSWYQYQSYVLTSSLKDDEEHILVSTYDFTDEGYSVFKVNLKTAKFEKAVNNVNDIDFWYADRKGRVRVGVAVEKKEDKINRTIWYRAAEQDELQKLHTRTYGVGETFDLIGLNEQGDKAYVLSDRETGFQSLWLYDIPKGEFEQMLYTHPQYDLEDGLFDSQGELIGAYYYDDYYRSYYFDPADGEQEAAISAVLKGLEVTVVSRSADKKKLLAMAVRDDKVPAYFYFDLSKNKGGAWVSQYPQLNRTSMQPVEPYAFEASDGQKITGYLTMPKGIDKPALIVYPHGGPYARDYRYFDPKVQLLAAKGYAVLQVNFRGSEGFGTAFETAGYYQWGKRMQQDVYEAMDWLLASGRVSQTKACIVGASYGGYVALTAAYQHPERFDCVVSVSGISDLEELVQDEERQDSFIGNIVDLTDKNAIDQLAQVSAINYLDKIKSPVLLIHGTKDTRVNYDQSRSFYSKAKSRLDIKYIEIKDGTHFFDDYESNLTFIRELDSFLTKHL